MPSQNPGWNISGNNAYSTVSGNIGIGTSTPLNKLEVVGSVNLNNALYITNSGKVGVGTSTPTQSFEVNGKISATNIGSTFTRWGTANTPINTTLLYSGYAFNEHAGGSQGGGAQAVCVKSGDAGATGPGANYGDLLYAVETGDATRMPPGISAAKQVKCAVAYVDGPVVEMWGTSSCPSGWRPLYTGYGMARYYTIATEQRRCVDNINFDSSVASATQGDTWYGTVLYDVNDLPTGHGYTTNTYVKCAVCAKG